MPLEAVYCPKCGRAINATVETKEERRKKYRYGRFLKDVEDGMIEDTETGLEWLVGPDRDTNWEEARKWIEGLEGNWRMPTRSELQALYHAGTKRNRWGPFTNNGGLVWAAGERDSSSAWCFNFYSGSEDWGLRTSSLNTRAFGVRSLDS